MTIIDKLQNQLTNNVMAMINFRFQKKIKGIKWIWWNNNNNSNCMHSRSTGIKGVGVIIVGLFRIKTNALNNFFINNFICCQLLIYKDLAEIYRTAKQSAILLDK